MKPASPSVLPQLRRGIALVLMVAVMGVVAMASSPGLHGAAHHDASQADHECAVTLFAAGALHDAAPEPVVVPQMDLVLDRVVVERREVASISHFTGILEHAPPRRA